MAHEEAEAAKKAAEDAEAEKKKEAEAEASADDMDKKIGEEAQKDDV